jgi:MFS transporter, DHA1 family, multidrug resistance protein
MKKPADSGLRHGVPAAALVSGPQVALLAGLGALGSLATNIILPAFPDMAASLDVTERELGLTLSSFFIAFGLGQLFVGPLSDRFGRKWPLLAGVAVFVAGSAICVLASNLEIMIAGRILQALGACATAVLSRAIARDLYEGEALARVLAMVMVAMAAAPGFSPLIGSALNHIFGWQLIFFGLAVFAVLIAWIYAANIGETRPALASRPPSLSQIMLAYGQLARDGRFIFPALSVGLILGSLYTFFATAPSILITTIGLTSFQLALYFAATVVIVFSAGFLAPRLSARFGAQTAAMTGAVIALCGSLLILTFSGTPDLWSLTCGLSLFLFGMGVLNPVGTAITLGPFGAQAGLASALLGFLQMGCAAIGATLASVIDLPPAPALGLVMTVGSLLAMLAFAGVFLKAKHKPQHPA